MATEKTTAMGAACAQTALAHQEVRAASSILQYVLVAERERGNTNLADTLVAADEALERALEALDAALTSTSKEAQR